MRAKDNDMTMIRLKENRIFLEICPTSNLQTKAFLRYEDLPIRLFLLKGVHFFLNSDNMCVSMSDVNEEYKAIIKAFKLHKNEVYLLLCNALEASFISDEDKWTLKKMMDEKFENWYLNLKV